MHPTLPYLLTSSDDMLIKLWDWDKACPADATHTPHDCHASSHPPASLMMIPLLPCFAGQCGR